MNLESAKAVGLSAARRGAGALLDRFGKLARVSHKSALELVTDADEASERAIVETIRNAFPDHEILAEESGRQPGRDGCMWIIDPLDGTTNFVHGLPCFAVSIGYWEDGKPAVGIVLDPLGGELFTAVTGQGARRNGRPIGVSQTGEIADSLLATGFPYDCRGNIDRIVGRLAACLGRARGIRRMGAAALDLCAVACGRFEAFWEEGLQPWDTAAGALIAAEAGARVTDFSDKPHRPGDGEILATNGRIHREMMAMLATKGNRE